MPGYGSDMPFKVYSGYLTVTDVPRYDSLRIHYQFHTSQRNATKDPVATWVQGGPGGSSISVGLYTEMGFFLVSDKSGNGSDFKLFKNDYAWNRVSSMLYLEHPAGVDFSQCIVGGKPVPCHWDDVSQAQAYYRTLEAFYAAFPEFGSNDLYITGESYAGQYVPNIVNYIHTNARGKLPLKGFALGNACWGGDATHVNCNGPNAEQNDVDLFYGKGLVAKKLRDEIYQTCDFPNKKDTAECNKLMEEMDKEVGPHNVYDIYDNCPDSQLWHEKSGKSRRWLRNYLRDNMVSTSVRKELLALGGGYDWNCGGEQAAYTYLGMASVQAALHLGKMGESQFHYQTSGPASITLYPSLIGQYRILIYNGDADSCVPYPGNEEWTTDMAAKGVISEKTAWHPWYVSSNAPVPAGYATDYTVPNSDLDFSFVTIRLAGHMVPTFQPEAAFAFYERFLAHEKF